MPRKRARRNYFPSGPKVLALLLKCFPLDGRDIFSPSDFTIAFRSAALTGTIGGEVEVCGTPLRWISYALNCSICKDLRLADAEQVKAGYKVSDNCSAITQLRSLDEVFMKHATTSKYLSEFILMDVICNRKITPTAAATLNISSAFKTGDADIVALGPDDVIMAPASGPEDLDDANDYKYRTLLAFLPGPGVFYCARDWRRKTEGVEGSRIALDMSWFRLRTNMSVQVPPGSDFRLQFGEDGYVKRFASVTSAGVSAWRVLYYPAAPRLLREVFVSTQCADHDGPRMPPDIIAGHDVGAWPVADRAQEYNRRLVNSNSARVGGRHYAPGCLHLKIPDTCWTIDPLEHPFVDIIVDIAPSGSGAVGRKSIIMVRSILDGSHESRYCHMGRHDLLASIEVISEHNSRLRREAAVGTARQNTGDVGTMHAIGTRVLLDGMTTVGFAANDKVPQPLLRSFVEAFATVGLYCFPDVLSVVQNVEADSSLVPIAPMDGNGKGLRVGYTIDVSVDLGNASHFDVNDASQGFSLWTEEKPGCGSNWYFLIPNLYGKRKCGTDYNGIAIKLSHATAISWDGRALRHCTSVSRPDGEGAAPVGTGWKGANHLFGTFTAAKEKIVAAGRAHASESPCLEVAPAGHDKRSCPS
ncbi:hypothetical protein MHU86_8685 [Fragilaria crotonensis]|nr:hypothetical protein MHU86_8685 [Fragilaria crotonensis]